ncbi:MAG: YncE family protein [Fibrobacteres bacterium]|nr:YncE family protein [Fibrobacterota bacterium]
MRVIAPRFHPALLLFATAVFATSPTALIVLPGVSGRIDHLALDAAGKRLFVAALGNNSVEVVDLSASKPIRSLQGLAEPQGVAYIPASGHLYVADGGDGKVIVFDAKTFERLRILELGSDADNVRVDPHGERVYVGYGDGGIAAIEDASGRIVWRATLPGHPEAFQCESSGSRLFVNIPDAGEIAVIEKDHGRLIAHWKTGDLKSNFPMALDEAGHRLFVGFRSPPALAVFDADKGKMLARETIHRDADDVYWDSASTRILIACGEGILDRFTGTGPQALKRLEPISTRNGARTGIFDPEDKVFYLAIPKRWNSAAEIRVIPLE